MYNDEILFVKQVEVNTGEVKLDGYLYYNPSRATKEKENFYKRLFQIKDSIQGLDPGKRGIYKTIREIAGDNLQYLTYRIENQKIDCKLKEKKITRKLNRAGIYLLSYKGNFSWIETLSAYKNKDLIEKGFNTLKNDMEIHTPNMQKTESLKGLVFLSVIGLMLRTRIIKLLSEKKLTNKYSVDKIIAELKKLQKIKLYNNQLINTEISKKQLFLLQILDAVPNS
jgi:transposase